MKFRNLAAATAALSLISAPVMAQANVERASAPATDQSELHGSAGTLIIAILAILAIIAAAAIASNDHNSPVSP
jgi:hypothetical protein